MTSFAATPPTRAKSVLDPKQFRDRIVEEIMLVTMVRPRRGRPELSCLDRWARADYARRKEAGLLAPFEKEPDRIRLQADILVVVRIIDTVLVEMHEAGEVPHVRLERFLTPDGKREYASKLLTSLSATRVVVVPNGTRQSWWKSTGRLLKIARQEPFKIGGAGRYSYVRKDDATDVEIRAAANTRARAKMARDKRDLQIEQIFEDMLASMQPGMTAAEAYADEMAAALAESRAANPARHEQA